MSGETGHGTVLRQLWVTRSKFKKKDKAHQWKVEEFLHTILLDQAITVRTINILAVEKELRGDFSTWLVMMRA